MLIEKYIVTQRDWQETFEHMAKKAREDGKMAQPYLGSETKGEKLSDDRLKKNRKRMEENEIWLKTYLLNDADDWEEVQKRKNELF